MSLQYHAEQMPGADFQSASMSEKLSAIVTDHRFGWHDRPDSVSPGTHAMMHVVGEMTLAQLPDTAGRARALLAEEGITHRHNLVHALASSYGSVVAAAPDLDRLPPTLAAELRVGFELDWVGAYGVLESDRVPLDIDAVFFDDRGLPDARFVPWRDRLLMRLGASRHAASLPAGTRWAKVALDLMVHHLGVSPADIDVSGLTEVLTRRLSERTAAKPADASGIVAQVRALWAYLAGYHGLDTGSEMRSFLAQPVLVARLNRALGGKAVSRATETQKPSRNAVCPCGSGLKYKRCCGK